MTMDQMLVFKPSCGIPFAEYEEMLRQRERIVRRINKWANAVWDERDSLSVLYNPDSPKKEDWSERDVALYRKHSAALDRAHRNLLAAERELDAVERAIAECC